MRDDYLWDRSGVPDPEVQRLERLLIGFRSQRGAPELPAKGWRLDPGAKWGSVAAAVALMAAGTWLISGSVPEGWQVARDGASSRLTTGQTLETGPADHATLNLGVGTIDVEPNSRLRLERVRKTEQRMSLEYGLIHAFIWAPPRTFVVDTPSAVATDLGCFYTLSVDPDGGGLLKVEAGWVSFAHAGRESFIPAGAACRMRPGYGPGTPYREQATPAFIQALRDFDFAGGGGALDIVLKEATKEDAFTLWHLLTRCQASQLTRVYDSLAVLVPPPEGVTQAGIQRRDPQMLDRWWNQLGLGQTGWWREWERQWPAAPAKR